MPTPAGQCKLCLQQRELQDGNYIPRSVYGSNRAPKLKNPNPILLSDGKTSLDTVDGHSEQVSVPFARAAFKGSCSA